MIKSFENNKYGRGQEYWDRAWDSYDLEIDSDYSGSALSNWFEKYIEKDGTVLEGGCGPGYYVRYLQKKGYSVIGIDSAPQIIERVKSKYPDMPVYSGDVTNLDYPDNYFSAYYSGGVVEHVESGPDDMIREAYRVLRPGGVMFLTVPYINIRRRLIIMVHKLLFRRQASPGPKLCGQDSIWRFVKGYDDSVTGNPDYHFHEYIMTGAEIGKQVRDKGFEIIEISPFSIKCGLRDFLFFRNLQARVGAREQMSNSEKSDFRPEENPIREISGLRQFWQKTTTTENPDGLVSYSFTWLMRMLFGHMVIVICRKPVK